MNYDFLKECEFAYNFIKTDRFLKQVYFRHFHGYQTYIQLTGSTNAGKTFLGNWIYWILTHGMYKREPTLEDFFFSIEDLSKQISNISNRCIRNNEAGKRGKFWNDKQNELWSKVLQQQRIQKNTYLDDLPHRKEGSGTMNVHINYLVIVENFIADYLKKQVKEEEIQIEDIEDYQIIRIAKVYRYIVDYLGFNPRANTDYFVIPVLIDKFVIPEFEKDKRCVNFWDFTQKTYMPYEIEGKNKLAKLIEKETRLSIAKKKKKDGGMEERSLEKFY